MKKILLFICTIYAMCLAEGKCDAYAEKFSAQLLVQVAQRSDMSRDALYPMLYFCFWESFKNSLDPNFDWEKARKKMEGLPTDKGVLLYDNIHQANEKIIQEFIRSGEMTVSGIHPCLLTDYMLENLGTFLWNKIKKEVRKGGVSNDAVKFVFLDKKICKDWGSRKITKKDFE